MKVVVVQTCVKGGADLTRLGGRKGEPRQVERSDNLKRIVRDEVSSEGNGVRMTKVGDS